MPCSDRFTDIGEGATFCQSIWLETSPWAERLLIGCRPAPHWDVEAAIVCLGTGSQVATPYQAKTNECRTLAGSGAGTRKPRISPPPKFVVWIFK